MKQRAKTLAEHLSATRRNYDPSLPQKAEESKGRGPNPQINYFEKESTNLIVESRASLKNLDKINTLLGDALNPGVSNFKQSLVLSRLSQILESESARRNSYEWESKQIEQIKSKLLQKSYPDLETLLNALEASRNNLAQIKKEIISYEMEKESSTIKTTYAHIEELAGKELSEKSIKIGSVFGTGKRLFE